MKSNKLLLDSIVGSHTLDYIQILQKAIDRLNKKIHTGKKSGEELRRLQDSRDALEQMRDQYIKEVKEWVSYFPTCYDNYRKVVEYYYCSINNLRRSLKTYLEESAKVKKLTIYRPSNNFRKMLWKIEIEMIEKGIYPPTTK